MNTYPRKFSHIGISVKNIEIGKLINYMINNPVKFGVS